VESVKQKVNILPVDDQPGKLLGYEAILGELDENLIKAASGREALEYLLKNDIAVVLVDVNMPGMDGFELADMIRQHPRFEETAMIFISAVHLTDLDRLRGNERGGVDYISVPVIPELHLNACQVLSQTVVKITRNVAPFCIPEPQASDRKALAGLHSCLSAAGISDATQRTP
jgi:CheY-like chemotaxis protein